MAKQTIRAALYLRVSTSNGQTVENQRRQLRKVAKHRGWEIVATYQDEGISGAKGRDKRPGFDNLLKGAARGDFDTIMAWSSDRLGRSLLDLIGFLQEIHSLGVDLYLDRNGVDTSTPGGKAMFGMMSVFAEFELDMIRERTNAGLARARAKAEEKGETLATRGLSKRRKKMKAGVLKLHAAKVPLREIARETGLARNTVKAIVRSA